MKPPAVHWYVNDTQRHYAQCGAVPVIRLNDGDPRTLTGDPVRVTCRRCWRFVRGFPGYRRQLQALREQFAAVMR